MNTSRVLLVTNRSAGDGVSAQASERSIARGILE